MSAETEYERLRNTYYYEITSDDGLPPANQIGDFNFLIPPYPLAEHNQSQRAIFTLQGVVVGDQIANQQIGQISFLNCEIQGLGGFNNNYNSTSAGGVAGQMIMLSKIFMIPNVYDEYTSTGTNTADGTIITNTPIQRMSGSFDLTNPYKLICGNPSGQTLRFLMRNDVGALIGNNGNLKTIVRFSIELIDAE